MKDLTNEFGQPIGFPVQEWQRPFPDCDPMIGQWCDVVALDVERHQKDLSQAFVDESRPQQWTYLAYGPFADRRDFRHWLISVAEDRDPMFHVVVEKTTGKAVGLASYLEIRPHFGVIEIGHIHFSPGLQKTIASTEAMYLMMKRAIEDWGYRRYEWKCDALNANSRKAALRLGFQFEGVFRQAVTYKGRNRDTAWFSITDQDWPRISEAFKSWLSETNFDSQGQQRQSLSELRAEAPFK